ncbi:response regulator [Paenibacillus tengchongensis]|uniref:response regulator n=1 Tax=Paenibacillus tengchongensis TaxID=2608684 RepID=UPI00124CE878|nr:response regulator [Paenibacillus tengchongensis]
MKIKAKLLIGFSALLAIMLALTLIGYDRLNYMNDQLDSYQERYSMGRASSGLRGEVNDMARILTTLMLNADTLSVDAQQEEIDTKVTKSDAYIKTLKSSMVTAEEMQLLSRIEKAYSAYMNYQNKALSMLTAGYFQNANAYRNTEGQAIQNEMLDSLNALSDYNAFRMTEETAQAQAASERSIQMVTLIMIVGLLMGLGVILWVIPSITRGLNVVSMMISSFGNGKMRAIRRIKVTSKDEIGEVARVFKEMAEDLEQKQEMEKAYAQAQNDQAWLNANVARVTELLRGMDSLDEVTQTFINEFAPVLGAQYGAIYLKDRNNPSLLTASAFYAGEEGVSNPKQSFTLGQGLIGQSALDMQPIHLLEAPEDYIAVASGLGDSRPGNISIHPLVFEDELLGVVEFASFKPFTSLQSELFHQLAVNLGVILNNISRRLIVEELLRESQALTEELQVQSEELQTQQEELRRSNENLEEQTDALKRSEELLQRQQGELEHYNNELMAKTQALEEQVQEVEEKKDEIEEARKQLEKQAHQLAVTSKYKSEFLANMSHELRTPLNSLLILSQLLTENKEGNLSEKQVEFAHTIYMSGSDLLKMIDEILDLSKVESGKMELSYEEIPLTELKTFVKQNFAPQAQKKGLALRLTFDEPLPNHVYADSHRLKQILRNLLSNAFKFTSKGFVEFNISHAEPEKLPAYLPQDYEYVAIAVRDSGIGIPQDKREIIFEAFQQVDGTTSRKYGGTGLGLSISRELARLLGGAITLESSEGQGSTFTLYLPVNGYYSLLPGVVEAAAAQQAAAIAEQVEELLPSSPAREEKHTPLAAPVDDDREALSSSDKVLLIVEDDESFAKILLGMARSRGFKGLVALQGDIGLKMAKAYLPDAIILDIQLPVMDGWAILRELKGDSETRHIPVHVISVNDEVKQGLMMGAMAYLRKPSTKEALERAFSQIENYTDSTLKHLLIVEDDDIQRRSIMELIGHDDVAITAVSSGGEALAELRKQRYDCMVLDLMLDDMDGFELLDQIRDDEELNDLPIIIYTGKDLDSKEETRLRKYAESIIIKDVRSPERLLDETTLFLHRVEANLPEDKRKILQKLHNKEELFDGKKILLVDDDIRNVFALSSVLEGYHMEVKFAENGREALDMLKTVKDFDLILMDMMMPEMDGYEAMRLIRQMPEYQKLPIIALTAKAMKEDRSKCIEAGASDYMKKPISTDQLLSLMRVWLYS